MECDLRKQMPQSTKPAQQIPFVADAHHDLCRVYLIGKKIDCAHCGFVSFV
jgi:hypothetical protein